MPVNIEALMRQYDRLKDEHQLWRPLWQDIGDLIRPTRANFNTQRTPGSKQTERLFDSTAPMANERLAATLNGTLTNPASDWFSLTIRDEVLADDKDVMVWLEEVSRRMHRALNQSNFHQEALSVYLDTPAFGTAALFVEERESGPGFAGLVFTALALSSIGIDEDAEGRVNTLMRCFLMSCGAIVDKWGLKNVSEKIAQAYKDNKLSQTFEILHSVRPRREGLDGYPNAGSVKTRLPWESCYIALDGKKVMAEGGYHEFPAMVPRWDKTPGEKYGRGVGHIALPDVKTLNKEKELSLKTWAKTLDMPMVVEEESLGGPLRSMPSGVTVIRNMERRPQPLYPTGMHGEAVRANSLEEEKLISSIRDLFYADLELPEGPIMTATEVLKRIELVQRKLGPVVGRMKAELLRPLIDRVYGIMFRRGALPPPPEVLLENGAEIDIEYQGPLENSQRLAAVEGLERMQAWTVQTAAIDPSVLDNINFDAAAEVMAEVLSVPAKVMRSEEEVAEIRDARAKQQAEQQQKADLAMLADGAGKAAPMVKALQEQGAPA